VHVHVLWLRELVLASEIRVREQNTPENELITGPCLPSLRLRCGLPGLRGVSHAAVAH